jgi:hypothetical protein
MDLELILNKLDQLSRKLDHLEKKIDQLDRTASSFQISQENVSRWEISQELLNQKNEQLDWENHIDDYIVEYQNDVSNLQLWIQRHQDDVHVLRGKTVELFKFGHLLREKIMELDRIDDNFSKN